MTKRPPVLKTGGRTLYVPAELHKPCEDALAVQGIGAAEGKGHALRVKLEAQEGAAGQIDGLRHAALRPCDDPQTLPADLEGLVWDMVAQAYASLQNGSQGLSAFSISDVDWKFDKSTNPEWVRLVNLYRRY